LLVGHLVNSTILREGCQPHLLTSETGTKPTTSAAWVSDSYWVFSGLRGEVRGDRASPRLVRRNIEAGSIPGSV
jgi:hypothetical protein